MSFDWNEIQQRADGRILLLYRHERIFEEGFVKKGMKVLDVGGWGVLASRLLEEGCDCLILDKFTDDQRYPERVRSLPHVEGDAHDTGLFPPSVFDLVTCFEMLEHVSDFAVLDNFFMWLKPGGWLVGTTPIPGEVHSLDDPTARNITAEALKDGIQQAGFTRVQVEASPSVTKTSRVVCNYFTAQRAAPVPAPVLKRKRPK